jgi:hypothetical protein
MPDGVISDVQTFKASMKQVGRAEGHRIYAYAREHRRPRPRGGGATHLPQLCVIAVALQNLQLFTEPQSAFVCCAWPVGCCGSECRNAADSPVVVLCDQLRHI